MLKWEQLFCSGVMKDSVHEMSKLLHAPTRVCGLHYQWNTLAQLSQVDNKQICSPWGEGGPASSSDRNGRRPREHAHGVKAYNCGIPGLKYLARFSTQILAWKYYHHENLKAAPIAARAFPIK